jgi:hypothetical protein
MASIVQMIWSHRVFSVSIIRSLMRILCRQLLSCLKEFWLWFCITSRSHFTNLKWLIQLYLKKLSKAKYAYFDVLSITEKNPVFNASKRSHFFRFLFSLLKPSLYFSNYPFGLSFEYMFMFYSFVKLRDVTLTLHALAPNWL